MWSDVQSALVPRGPAAADIALMGWVMFAGGAVVFAVVMALLVVALRARREQGGDPMRRSHWLVIGGGIVFPTAVLTALLVWTMWLGAGMASPPADPALTIRVTGWRWWWEVHYLTPDGPVESANEIRIPVGEPVALELVGGDVIHSFWVPSLHGKMDMIPGRTNRFVLEASEPASLRGQCAEYCGLQHAVMAFSVEAMEPDAFRAWLAREAEPQEAPADPALAFGMRSFLEQGCGGCHAVRGIEWEGIVADGEIGPDLTHFGSRRFIAAGALPNAVGPLAGWIADAQHVKPGNRMPSYDTLDGPTLRAIATWLGSLE
jgi:cytochrome c oxidase subunit 2